jgi:hypothetical protein
MIVMLDKYAFMKSCLVFLASVVPALALIAEQSAQVTLYCNSLRFPPASSGSQTLSLTTASDPTQINNELAPVPDPTLPSYGSGFALDDPTLGAITGQIYFDTPPPSDTNDDGFDDFYQVAQAVPSTVTQGEFFTAVDNGTVTATWGREAGSSTGSCSVQLTAKTFGQLGTFTFTFELLTYKGVLNYTPATNPITGSLNLTNVESASNLLTGPVTLTRADGAKRFNNLTLQAGTLTNAQSQVLSYQAQQIQRDVNRNTNYYGFMIFADGDLTTSTPDFTQWVLSIDDSNDANHNGVPDLSDDPSPPVSTPPLLSLTQSGNQLLLTITAAASQSYQLQEIVSLGQTNWQTTQTVAVTNSPQTVLLPIPETPTRFWRLRAP